MSDLISRQAAISAICNACGKIDCDEMDKCEKLQLPSANSSEIPNNSDCISRQAAIDAILAVTGNSSVRELYEHVQEHGLSEMWSGGVNAAIDIIIAVPSAQPTQNDRVNSNNPLDCISRAAAIKEFSCCELTPDGGIDVNYAIDFLNQLPSAQPDLSDYSDKLWRNAYERGKEEARIQKMQDMEQAEIQKAYELGKLDAMEEIVRCRDCKHWNQATAYNGGALSFGFCESDDMWRSLYGETTEVSHIHTDDDFFCGYAERREE